MPVHPLSVTVSLPWLPETLPTRHPVIVMRSLPR